MRSIAIQLTQTVTVEYFPKSSRLGHRGDFRKGHRQVLLLRSGASTSSTPAQSLHLLPIPMPSRCLWKI